MTPEEAYKILNGEIIYGGGRNNGKRFAMGELNRVINEALEKQIPKKPKKEDKENLFCPTCDCFLGFESVCRERNFNKPHCSCCGQAIKWESD